MARPTPEEIKDMRDQPKLDKAYEGSLRTTVPAPAASAASKPKKMAKGGYVRAADGIAQRGKTKGRVL